MKVILKLRSKNHDIDGNAWAVQMDYIPNENDFITMQSDRLDPDEVDYMVEERHFFYECDKVFAELYVRTVEEVMKGE